MPQPQCAPSFRRHVSQECRGYVYLNTNSTASCSRAHYPVDSFNGCGWCKVCPQLSAFSTGPHPPSSGLTFSSKRSLSLTAWDGRAAVGRHSPASINTSLLLTGRQSALYTISPSLPMSRLCLIPFRRHLRPQDAQLHLFLPSLPLPLRQ